jgi:hypothetical protein
VSTPLEQQLYDALRLAYPYALDAWTNEAPGPIRDIINEDMIVISAARKTAERAGLMMTPMEKD